MSLQKFKDDITMTIYGMTTADAIEQGICLECKEKALPKCYSAAGKREYQISGLCEKCFDEIMGG